MLAKWIDLEVNLFPIRPHHHLTFQVHRDAGIAAEIAVLDQLLTDRARQPHRQDAVLETIVEEDVSEIRCDDAADTKIQQRPWRVLAGGPAAEILKRDDDFGL